MPVVNIEWTPGRTQQQKDEIAKRVVAALKDVAGVAETSTWVTFSEIPASDWYIGNETLAEIRRKKQG